MKDISFETYEKQRGAFGKLSDLREAVRALIEDNEIPDHIQVELYDVEIKLYDLMLQAK